MISLARLFRFSRPFNAPLLPDRACAVVGDIHGNLDALDRMLARLDHAGQLIVFVGDYIDRGENSREVLVRLMKVQQAGLVQCLAGNHEAMMLDFLDHPVRGASLWLRNGGLQTLASFGIGTSSDAPGEAEARDIAAKLAAGLGPKVLDWLRVMPKMWRSGNIVVAHAALDPHQSVAMQTDATLQWGHRDFRRHVRKDGIWVVHGHTIVPEPIAKAGVISIDTGAYATNRLSAALIREDEVEFVTV